MKTILITGAGSGIGRGLSLALAGKGHAIIAADLALVVMTTDEAAALGTCLMIRDLYKLFEKKTGIIMNKVPWEGLSAIPWKDSSMKVGSRQLPIVGALPCLCDILEAEGGCLYALEKPNHPFTVLLREIAATIEQIRPTMNALRQIP